jgi:hypothetical protein
MPVAPSVTGISVVVMSSIVSVGLIVGARAVIDPMGRVVAVIIVSVMLIVGAIGVVAMTIIGLVATVALMVAIFHGATGRRCGLADRYRNQLQQ